MRGNHTTPPIHVGLAQHPIKRAGGAVSLKAKPPVKAKDATKAKTQETEAKSKEADPKAKDVPSSKSSQKEDPSKAKK